MTTTTTTDWARAIAHTPSGAEACAGCAFIVPKASAKGQMIAAKAYLERHLERVPLTEFDAPDN